MRSDWFKYICQAQYHWLNIIFPDMTETADDANVDTAVRKVHISPEIIKMLKRWQCHSDIYIIILNVY